MSREAIRNTDPLATASDVQQIPAGGASDASASYVRQRATSGSGHAVHAQSDNPDAAAVVVQGAGDLLSLRDASGAVVYQVGQGGGVAASGASLGEVSPAAQGLTAWSYDPSVAVNAIELTVGTVYLVKLHIAADATVSKLYWWMPVAGATPVAGQNFGGLYSSSGALLASVDADATVTATAGLQTLTLSSTALEGGSFVWAALLFNAATNPTLAYASGATGALTAVNVGLSAATLRYAVNGTGATELPASITPASNTGSLLAGPWVAVGP